MQLSLFILTAATLTIASPNATPIVEKRCLDSSDLVECCQEIGPTNTTLFAAQGIDAPVDTSRMVGYNCSLPTIEIAGQASQWYVSLIIRSRAGLLVIKQVARIQT